MKTVLKYLRDNLPFKRQLFSAFKSTFGVPESAYRHLYFEGQFTVKYQNLHFEFYHNQCEIANELFWKGFENTLEKYSLVIWYDLCKNNEVIWDVGAFDGLYAIVAQATNPRAEVYSFEPNPLRYAYLQRNVKINDFNIRTFNLGLSDQNGSLNFVESTIIEPGSDIPHDPDKMVQVKVGRAEDLIQAQNLKLPKLIKLDVERYEPQVLRGFGEYFKSLKDAFFLIEVLDQKRADQLNEMLLPLGHELWDINDKTGDFTLKSQFEKSSHYNFLCIPQQQTESGRAALKAAGGRLVM